MLYFCYGSNLNKNQMRMRCPGAVAVGPATMENTKLMFNGRYGGAGVANITHATGHIVPGALWEITDTDLVALDKYEGYPSLYGRNNDFEVTLPNGDKIEVLTYFMVSYKLGALPLSIPSEMYFNIIKEGYNDFGLSLYYLAEAYHTTVGEIWRQKNKKAGVDNYESFGFSSK